MSKFRKKLVVVEAIQWIGTNRVEVAKFIIDDPSLVPGDVVLLNTLEGRTIYADINDWIIKGVKGEFYPCKPDIFEMTYEPVTELSSNFT